MTLDNVEATLILYAINRAPNDQPRKFQFVELADIVELSDKFSDVIKDGKINEGEYQFEFSTEEKNKIIVFLKEHQWMAGDAKKVLEIITKLE